MLSRVIRKAKIIEHDKLIQNSQIKLKPHGVLQIKNLEEIQRSELQAVNMEGKKINYRQTIADTYNDYFVAIAENVKRQRKNHFINNVMNMENLHHFMC